MGFKVLIVGCGAQGKVISTYAARSTEVDEVRLSDINLEECKRHADWLKNDKVSVHRVDASKTDEVSSLARGVDVVVNAVLPIFNLNIMDAALKAGANYIDLAFGEPYENLEKELERNRKFKDAGLTAVTGFGCAPGITNILAAYAVDKLDHVNDIVIRLASMVKVKEQFMKWIPTWSPELLVADCVGEPVIFQDGEFRKVPPFSGEETYTFPDPTIETQTLYYHLHEEPFTLGRFIGKGLKNVYVKKGGPEITLIKTLWEQGLLSDKPINVKNVKVTPRDVYLALAPRPITMDELRQKVEAGIIADMYFAILVEVVGEKEGKSEHYILWSVSPKIRDIIKTMPVANTVSYLTGTSCWLMTKQLGKGEIKTKGVITPELLEPAARHKFLEDLALQDPPIIVYERVERRIN